MAKKQLKVTGVRRREQGGKVEVRTNGGWLGWGMVSPQVQKSILDMPICQPHVLAGFTDKSWILTPFKVEWGAIPSAPIGPIEEPATQALDGIEEEWAEALEEATEEVSDGNDPEHCGDEHPFDHATCELPPRHSGVHQGYDDDGALRQWGDGGDTEGEGDGSEGSENIDGEPSNAAGEESEGEGEGEGEGDGGQVTFYVVTEGALGPDSTPEDSVCLYDLVEGSEVVQPLIDAAIEQNNKDIMPTVAQSMLRLLEQETPRIVKPLIENGIEDLVPPMIANANVALSADMIEYTDGQIASVRSEMEVIAARAAASGSGGGVIVTVNVTRPNVSVQQQTGVFHKSFPQLLKYISLGLNVYLPGVPGGGKSHSAEQVAQTIGWEFGAISLGPTTPDSRLWGGKDAHGLFHEPNFIRCARFAQENPDLGAVFCLDEMDNGHPGIIATLNSALANGWFYAPNNDKIQWKDNFVVIGAANTYGTGPTAEFSGRNRLDAATLDRFVYVPWETDLGLEAALVRAHLADHANGEEIAKDWLNVWNTVRKSVEEKGLKIFVTMRGAINGAKMLAADVPALSVFNAVLGSKIPADQFDKINPF